jgi:hypothetical protein
MEFIEILVALVFFGGMALGALLTTLWYYCRSATATAGKTEATDHSSPDLRFCFGIVFVTGTGKSFHLQKDCQHIVGKKLEKYSNMAAGWSCFLLPSLPEISNDHDPS